MRIIKFLFFNRLIKIELAAFSSMGLGLGKRLKSIGAELLYVLSVFMPWIMPIGLINQILRPALVVGQPYIGRTGPLDIVLNVCGAILLIGLLNKDFFNGQSPTKRATGYQVVDKGTTQPANKIKCLIRNITAPIWPIELLMILINPHRRLGDYIAGTKVIDVPPTEPELILDEIEGLRIDWQTKVIIGISILIVIGYTTKFW